MEDVLPPQTEHGAGFELTRVRQFTVFMENRVGRLQALVRAFETKAQKIVALSIHNQTDTALVRIICSDADIGREILRREGFYFSEQDVLVVELPKSAQPLTVICATLLSAELNIHYAYPLLVRPGEPAVAVYLDDPTLAVQLLIKKGFKLLAETDLRK